MVRATRILYLSTKAGPAHSTPRCGGTRFPAQRHSYCPFGLGVVVVHFNRYPTLVVAAARRIFAMFVAAYFDDRVQVEPQLFAESAGALFLTILQALGTPPEPSKYHAMAAHSPCECHGMDMLLPRIVP